MDRFRSDPAVTIVDGQINLFERKYYQVLHTNISYFNAKAESSYNDQGP